MGPRIMHTYSALHKPYWGSGSNRTVNRLLRPGQERSVPSIRASDSEKQLGMN